jgi:putative PIN family toxin of toxin-antitoxin system
MPRKRHRVIIDTNLLISFLINSDFSKLERLLVSKKITLLFSQELIDEFVEVARRPKFKKYFTDTGIQELLTQISTRAEFIDVISKVEASTDPKDNFLLSLAKDGKATHLLTGDKELLSLKKFIKTELITITEYLAKS